MTPQEWLDRESDKQVRAFQLIIALGQRAYHDCGYQPAEDWMAELPSWMKRLWQEAHAGTNIQPVLSLKKESPGTMSGEAWTPRQQHPVSYGWPVPELEGWKPEPL